MNRRSKLYAIALVACASMPASAARAEANKVVIGDIDDMSGVYADIIGPGGVEAAKMAIADFGGSVLGKKIELLVTDHQNKPDLGAEKFREWADRDGLTMVLGGSNTGVNIAMATIAKEKKTPFFAIGAAGASLTGKDCTPYTVHYAYDTTALGNGTATTILKQGGKTWFFVTADYAFGTQLQDAAANVVTASGGKFSAPCGSPWPRPIFLPLFCRHRIRVRRFWALRTRAMTSPIRSRPPISSGSRGR